MIDEFQGKYRPLSNFWYKEVYLPDDKIIYPTNEHAYQAFKTHDLSRREIILHAATPSEAKALGNHKDTVLRDDWNIMKRRVMLHLIVIKFTYDDMEQLLLSTGQQKLIEGNTWHDNYWGVCTCQSCSQERARENPKLGSNWLGRLLMHTRLGLQVKRGIE